MKKLARSTFISSSELLRNSHSKKKSVWTVEFVKQIIDISMSLKLSDLFEASSNIYPLYFLVFTKESYQEAPSSSSNDEIYEHRYIGWARKTQNKIFGSYFNNWIYLGVHTYIPDRLKISFHIKEKEFFQ